MLKQKISAVLVALLVFVQVFNGFGQWSAANAAGITGSILDSVTLAVYDKAGNVVTDNVYEQGSKVQVDYNWSLPNGHGYKDGDTFSFTLPAEFLLFNNISGPLLIESDDVGSFTVNKDTRQVLMTFNSYIETHDDVRGILTIKTQFDKQKMTGSTLQKIKIPIKSGEQIISLQFKPNVASTIGKSGVPQGYNAKNIDWTVDVNKELKSVENAVMTDPLPAGLSAPVTAAVYALDVNLDGTVVQGALVDPGKYSLDTSGGTVKVSFADSPITTAYRIQFTTPLTDGSPASFTNTATFKGSNQSAVSASTTVTVQRGSALSKSSTSYDAATQTIGWAIKYNYNERNISQTNAVLTDLFDDVHELTANSVHVYPVTLDSAGSETVGGEIPAGDYTVTPASATGKNGFKLQFNQAVTGAYKITYETKTADRVIADGTVNNKVTSGSGDSATGSRPVKQLVLVKTMDTANYQDKTAAWTLTVNGDKQPMTDVVVTDAFPNKGMKIVPGTFKVKQGSTVLNSPADYTLDGTVTEDSGFKLTFAGPLSETVTISYKTEYNFDWITPPGSTKNFVNNADITWKDSTSTAQTKSVSATFTPRNEAKNNGFKNGAYNASTKQLSWTIGVNYNSKPLSSASVEDLLESKQTLVPGSLALYTMNIAANGNPSLGTIIDSSEYSYSVDSANKLAVSLLNPSSTPFYITYKTSLDGELIDSTVSNTAELFDAATPVSEKLTAKVTIPKGGEYVNKTGSQSGDKINWTININRGQSTVADAKIVDTPTENQLLLPESFRLYTTNVAANGDVVKSAEAVKGTDYNLVIRTDDDGKQTFELNFLNEITAPYVLEYQSLIVANDQDTVSNKVSFSGNNVSVVSKETTNSIVVGVSSGSGTGSGIRGSLTVQKSDAADSSHKLQGAVFELYRKSGSSRSLIDSGTTDSTGTLVFKKLLAGDYIIKEKTAPSGYVLDTTDRPVTINSTAGFTLNVTNAKVSVPTPTPPVTPTPTPPVTPTPTPPVTPTPTPPVTPTPTPPVTPTPTPKVTPTPTPPVTPTPTPPVTPTPTPPVTPTPTPPVTPTPTPSVTPTPTPSSSPSDDDSSETPTPTPTPSVTPTPTPSVTPTPTPSVTPGPTPSVTPGPTPSETPAPTPSVTPTPGPTSSPVTGKVTTDKDTPIGGKVVVPEGQKPFIGKQPEHGKVSIDENGRWTYTPDPGYTGKDRFTVAARDSQGNETVLALLDVTVQTKPVSGQQNPDTPAALLPQTGEYGRWYIQAAGLALIALGLLWRRKLTVKK
ncbi:collagen binding domain-containing protein [Paenibacillus sp. 1P03SA]|uniref:collagen binding domain-containing protein n=1 Tax=Paenibacillus sp. 1P03SA TaxID=3132294 RepID=UPI0039A05953